MADNKKCEICENIKNKTSDFFKNIDYQGIKNFIFAFVGIVKKIIAKPDNQEIKLKAKEISLFLGIYYLITFLWLFTIPNIFKVGIFSIKIPLTSVMVYSLFFLFIEFLILVLLLFFKEKTLFTKNRVQQFVIALLPSILILLIGLILSLLNPYLLIIFSLIALIAIETSYCRLTAQNNYYGDLVVRIIIGLVISIMAYLMIKSLISHTNINGLDIDKLFY